MHAAYQGHGAHQGHGVEDHLRHVCNIDLNIFPTKTIREMAIKYGATADLKHTPVKHS